MWREGLEIRAPPTFDEHPTLPPADHDCVLSLCTTYARAAHNRLPFLASVMQLRCLDSQASSGFGWRQNSSFLLMCPNLVIPHLDGDDRQSRIHYTFNSSSLPASSHDALVICTPVPSPYGEDLPQRVSISKRGASPSDPGDSGHFGV